MAKMLVAVIIEDAIGEIEGWNRVVLPNGNGVTAEISCELKRKLGLNLRELLSRTTCTAEERELLDLAAELEQAVRDGIISYWSPAYYEDGLFNCSIQTREEPHSYCVPGHAGDRVDTQIAMLRAAVAKVRELRAEHDAQAQAAAVAEQEARIMAVYEAGLIEKPVFPTEVNEEGRWRYCAHRTDRAASTMERSCGATYDDRLKAATALAAWAAALKPRLTEIDIMSGRECCAELTERGFKCTIDDNTFQSLCWGRDNTRFVQNQETCQTFHRETLRKVRALDGVK